MLQALNHEQTLASFQKTHAQFLTVETLLNCAAGSAPAAIPSLAAAPKRARRLQDWANRELQALLDQQDVSIVRSFVMSLANTHGLDHHQAHVLSRDASARTADAVRALQPFLHDRTEHFWHELK